MITCVSQCVCYNLHSSPLKQEYIHMYIVIPSIEKAQCLYKTVLWLQSHAQNEIGGARN